MPDYVGVTNLFRRLPRIWRTLRAETKGRDAVLMGRIPEPIAILMWAQAKLTRRQFVAFVVGDVDSVIRGGIPGRGGAVIAWSVTAIIKFMIRKSDLVVYVTRSSLQSKYPAHSGTPTLARSNVRLEPNDILQAPRNFAGIESRTKRLITVGNQQTRLKGTHLLLEAMKLLQNAGEFHLTLVGDGKLAPELVRLSKDLAIQDSTTFTGHLTDPRRSENSSIPRVLFVLPSLSEGLPRAMIEAMARGLPCVASSVGGVPELLAASSLVHPCTAQNLADRIQSLVAIAPEMEAQSRDNLAVAREVSEAAKDKHLVEFLSANVVVR